jgi:hypothetical protein
MTDAKEPEVIAEAEAVVRHIVETGSKPHTLSAREIVTLSKGWITVCAAVTALAAKRDAEAAVIEAAKRQADAGRRWETCTCGGRCAHEINYEMACSDTDFAVSTLRALEGDA